MTSVPIGSDLPQAPSAIAQAVAKYKPRTFERESKDDDSAEILPLQLLCLKVVADNFSDRPHIESLPAPFVTAITSSLPTDIDPTITGPHVNDENYWQRVCLEEKKWKNCQISEHGLSWKQLFFEKYISTELEAFGVYEGVTRKHEDEFLRAPIDSTHTRWATLYPGVPEKTEEGKYNMERFCRLGSKCNAYRILNSPNGIWPALDRFKSLLPGNLQYYAESYAGANLPDGAEGVVPRDSIDPDCDSNVLREYLTPAMVGEYNSTGEWPAEPQLCLLCYRFKELETLTRHIQVSEDYVFTLRLKQLLSHIDMELVFKHLPNLCALELTYGVRSIGMKYDRSLFGMKISDAMSLAKCVKATETLTSLILPCNMMDDDLVRMLMTGLIHNQTVTHLDLSHNKISNYGVRLLSKLLGSRSVLMSLNLADNQIHEDGGMYLGRALKRCDSLLELNLRLNRLQDEGGALLFEGLRENNSVTSLNVSSNSLRSGAAKAFATVIGDAYSSLVTADLSGNRFHEEDVQVLRVALRDNAMLTALDLRANPDVSPTSEHVADIIKITRKNELELRHHMRK